MPNHPQREEVLSRVTHAVQALCTTLSADEVDRFAAFARATLAQVRTVTFADSTAADAAAVLLDTWRFFSTIPSDGPNVRVRADADGGLVVTSVMVDQPFIVDTLRLALRGAGAQQVGGFNVVLRADRTGTPRIAAEPDGRAESVIRFETSGIDPGRAAEIESDLVARLGIARAMVADFEAMTRRTDAAAEGAFDVSGEEGIETAEFLRWLLSDNFVFVGVTGGGAPLGADRVPAGALWPAVDVARSERLIDIRKGAVDAPVHRAGRIDEVRVQLPGGPVVLRGMFTHRALTQPCRHLPILRRVLHQVLVDTRSRPNSYRYRGLANIFDSLPTEWLLSATPEQVREVLDRIFDAEQDQQARVHLTQQDGAQTTFALIAIPERRYSDQVRTRTLDFLQGLTGATYSDSGLFAGRFETVLLQVFMTGTRTLGPAEHERAQAFVTELTTPWNERVADALEARFGEAAPALLARYTDAFSGDYHATASGDESATDVGFLEQVRQADAVRARVWKEGDRVLLRVYEPSDILLTDLMPVLDNFGLLISDQSAYQVTPRGGATMHVDTFRIAKVPGLSEVEFLARAEKLVAGLEAVFARHIVSDAFNRLVLRADMRWDEVDLVRAYFGYARQLGLKHAYTRIQEILLNQAACAAAVVALFHAKFDPDLPGARAAVVAAAESALRDRLLLIKTNDEDLVMRTLANLVEATLRTNFFRTDRVAHYISFKVDHAKIKNMPLPRLMVEIYVHHREVEGVHLRGGPISRGGIRFSDRADFRTEILGLVATQMVKNVVIVPEGSKGGFYIKYTIDDPRERRRKGDELYQFLMRGMLDVTDNLVNGKVVRPPRVVAHDGDDPYLVVAADKGTAHLSDTANRISQAYGFWLGDAFASGGSQGYDHKEIGITARGAWVLVKRHFRELGMDADRDPFTCVGVGDCGGDVFGNGVIETPRMRLLGAFNHVHIFLDPDPDAEVSFAERKRLFHEVKGWDHYDRSKISAGGGVFDRKAKSIALSPQVKAILGTLQDELTPDQVISLMLKMPVDLLWNGGIGTYARASWETDADANDPPNDEVRVAASELRCKIVGEGGNLGFTQAARIEYALGGGRLNTDFVDNSGGVDTSDHEVNLKILLNPLVAAGKLTAEDRNGFLKSLTDEVAGAVLADNNANGRLISLDVVRSLRDPSPFGRAIDWICNKGNVSRAFLALPSDDDIVRRAANRQGLTRPELSVVQAHVKMHVFKMLMTEDEGQIPGFDAIVQGYFPKAARARFGAEIATHMLRKQIGMTVLLNAICTDAGACFFPLMMDLTGAGAGKVAGAWLHAMALTDGDRLKLDLIAAKARPEGAYRAWTAFTAGLTELVTGWLAPGSRGAAAEDAGRFQEALRAIAASRDATEAASVSAQVASFVNMGIPHELADRLVFASAASYASDVCAVAAARGSTVADAARHYQAVGNASKLLPALRAISLRRGAGRWDPVALGILRLRYQTLLRDAAVKVPPSKEHVLGVDKATEALSAGPLREVARITELILGADPDVASLLVGEQQIRAVLGQ